VGRFNLRVAREMLQFGWHMTLSTVFLWLIKNMDYYFVGKFLGKSALGFYQLAFRLSNMISTNVTKMLGSVLFPAFSEIGTDYTRAKSAWFRAARYTMVLIMPMGVGMIVFAAELTLGFYPRNCEVTIAPLAILTVFALCRALGTTLSDLAKGVGKPWILSHVAFWHALIMAPLLFLLVSSIRPSGEALISYWSLSPVTGAVVRFFVSLLELRLGILMVSIGVSGVALFAITLTFYLCAREVGITPRFALASLKPAMVASLAMAASGWLGKEAIYLVVSPSRWARLSTLALAGSLSLAVYGATLWRFYREVFSDLKTMLAKRNSEGGRRRAKEIKPATPVS
jgi:PST family polysaccharide transporter/lipopolysaccharide exporter